MFSNDDCRTLLSEAERVVLPEPDFPAAPFAGESWASGLILEPARRVDRTSADGAREPPRNRARERTT